MPKMLRTKKILAQAVALIGLLSAIITIHTYLKNDGRSKDERVEPVGLAEEEGGAGTSQPEADDHALGSLIDEAGHTDEKRR